MMDAEEILGLAEGLRDLGVEEFSVEGIHVKFAPKKPDFSEIIIPHEQPKSADSWEPPSNPADEYNEFLAESYGGAT